MRNKTSLEVAWLQLQGSRNGRLVANFCNAIDLILAVAVDEGIDTLSRWPDRAGAATVGV